MTSFYVNMSTKHLKLLELLSTFSCVNSVTAALTVLKLDKRSGGGGGASEAAQLRFKKAGLNRVKCIFMLCQIERQFE